MFILPIRGTPVTTDCWQHYTSVSHTACSLMSTTPIPTPSITVPHLPTTWLGPLTSPARWFATLPISRLAAEIQILTLPTSSLGTSFMNSRLAVAGNSAAVCRVGRIRSLGDGSFRVSHSGVLGLPLARFQGHSPSVSSTTLQLFSSDRNRPSNRKFTLAGLVSKYFPIQTRQLLPSADPNHWQRAEAAATIYAVRAMQIWISELLSISPSAKGSS